jgi:pilus assembly protein CpaB
MKRSLLLVLALVVGLFGTGAVALYASKADSRAQAGERQETVLVASKLIRQGTSVADAQKRRLFRSMTMAARDVPADAMTAVGDTAHLSAVTDVYPGVPLLRTMFSASVSTTGELTIPDGKMAMSVQLTDPERVAGFVVPGSDVAIFATIGVTYHNNGPQNGANDELTQLLLSRVPVLAVGPTSLRTESQTDLPQTSTSKLTKSESDPVSVAVLTVAVTEQEAAKLAHAAQVGDLTFALLSPSSKLPKPSAPVGAANIVNP